MASSERRATQEERNPKVLSSDFNLSIKNITPARDPKQCGEEEMMIIYLGDIRY